MYKKPIVCSYNTSYSNFFADCDKNNYSILDTNSITTNNLRSIPQNIIDCIFIINSIIENLLAAVDVSMSTATKYN